jgi:hypothetical protein
MTAALIEDYSAKPGFTPCDLSSTITESPNHCETPAAKLGSLSLEAFSILKCSHTLTKHLRREPV